ncbi:hypothetical protein ACHAPJ_000682 [Fusarium lateritium]
MASQEEDYRNSHPESGSLTTLSSTLHSGLIAITVFALLSFILASILFLYLTFKLVKWHIYKKKRANSIAKNIPEPSLVTDFSFLNSAFDSQGQTQQHPHDEDVERLKAAKNDPPNQFLILIFNLIIADMHQAAAFALSVRWIQKGGIYVDTPTCFVQGLFDSNGDLASSLFITAIAIHTYLSVVKNYRPPQKVLYASTTGIWVFVYCMSIVPLLATRNGHNVGGFYVRAGPWCWINDAYESLRLLTHYLFIFISLVTTSALYIAIYISLRRQATDAVRRAGSSTQVKQDHHPAFLIYPLIYVMCTLPLALGRIATMAGAKVPMGYYCFAGTLIASNGSFDCLLFGITRHAIVFGSSDSVDAGDTGIETFAFMRTPAGRLGNVVWIQGGENYVDGSNGPGGWWRLGSRSENKAPGVLRTRNASQESLRSAARGDLTIQMDVVTSVAVEVDANKERDPRYPDPCMSQTSSLSGGEKHAMKVV